MRRLQTLHYKWEDCKHYITNEKTAKLMQLNRLLFSSKTSPTETRSNNSGRYTILKSHIPWVFLPELLERVSVGRRLGSYRFASILQSSHLYWHIIIKKLVPYFDVILTFVFETSTFNYPNSQYLEIFTFIRIDFIGFSDKGLLEINSVFRKKMVVFFYADNWKKSY